MMHALGRNTFAELLSFSSADDPAAQLRSFRSAAKGAYVQTLDAAAVAGRDHLLFALKQTIELGESGQLLAEKAEVDFLLRVAGTAQISKAVRTAGSKPKSPSVLVVFGRRADVRTCVSSISRLAELTRFAPRSPGAKAAARLSKREVESVVDGKEALSRLLVEKAALLRR